MADNLLYWLVGFKLAGKSVDNALGHSGSKGLILSAGLYLLVRFFSGANGVGQACGE